MISVGNECKECDSSDCEKPEHCNNSCQAYGRVCPCAVRYCAKEVTRHLDVIAKDSMVFESVPLGGSAKRIPYNQLKFREKLGEGGYCTVHEVEVAVAVGGDGDGDRDHCNSFVIKQLRREIMVDPQLFVQGATDLVTEAAFLSVFQQHPNIIKLRAVSAGSVTDSIMRTRFDGKDSFFLVLDRLQETLEERLQKWRKEFYRNNNYYEYFGDVLSTSYASALWSPTLTNLQDLQHRLEEVMVPVAEALAYMHSKKVMLRDLKPENIGFDGDKTVKLFDFGLALELRGTNIQQETPAGSRRYMAPEVVLGKPYDLRVDAYSFGIMLWQVCALQQPFRGYTPLQHKERVVLENGRPSMVLWWPHELQTLIQQCWSKNPNERPSMETIVNSLKAIIQDLEDAKIRSTTSRNTTQLVPPIAPADEDEKVD